MQDNVSKYYIAVPIPDIYPEKLENYGTYLHEIILRLSEIKLIAARNLITTRENSKEIDDRKVKPFLGNVGDQVYVKKEAKTYGKLDDKYHGPYTLVKTTIFFSRKIVSIISIPPSKEADQKRGKKFSALSDGEIKIRSAEH